MKAQDRFRTRLRLVLGFIALPDVRRLLIGRFMSKRDLHRDPCGAREGWVQMDVIHAARGALLEGVMYRSSRYPTRRNRTG